MISLLRSRRCAAAALALPLAGCSIHPLPDNALLNFPRASTFDIVQRVRCEAKAGLDPLRRGRSREHVEKIIAATAIGYDFELVMAETNDIAGASNGNGLALAFSRPASASSSRGLSANLGGSATRHRNSIRTFRIIENLADVVNVDPADCPASPRANVAYPISGSLRVDEVVRTYVRLERISDLDDDTEEQQIDDLSIAQAKASNTRAGVFSETLRFKTSLSAGATPTLTLSAVVGRFRLTRASLDAGATRNDEHTLIIAFAQARDFKDDEYNRKLGMAREQRRGLIGRSNRLVRGAHTESAMAQAGTEYAQNQVELELSRQRNLLDDERDSARFLGDQLLRALRPPDETGPGD